MLLSNRRAQKCSRYLIRLTYVALRCARKALFSYNVRSERWWYATDENVISYNSSDLLFFSLSLVVEEEMSSVIFRKC